jgi:hypothetical protein
MAPLRIVDLTSTEFKRMICKVSKETFEEILDKTNLASWSDEKAELMLKKLKECPSSLRSMRSLIRLSVVNPDEFDPEAYPDLLTVETIFTNL